MFFLGDKLFPAVAFALDGTRERVCGKYPGRQACGQQLRLDGFRRERARHRVRNRIHDLGAGTARRHDAGPGQEIDARVALLSERGHLRCEGAALGADEAQHLDLARATMRQGDRKIDECPGDLTIQHVGECERDALVGHVQQVDLRRVLEQLDVPVGDVARPGRAEGKRRARGARQFDELLQVTHRHARPDHQRGLGIGHCRHRDEVDRRIIGKLRIEMRADGEHARTRKKQILPVGSRLLHRDSSDGAVGAGTIFHNDRNTRLRPHALGQHPRRNIDRAGRERNDDVYPAWQLRQCPCGQQCCRGQHTQQQRAAGA